MSKYNEIHTLIMAPVCIPCLAVSVSWPGVRGDVTLQPLGDVFVCPEAATSVFTCKVTNQLLQWMVSPDLEDSTIETRFFSSGSLVGATVASSEAVPFMAILDRVSGTSLSSTLTVQLDRTSHRVIIVKCSDVQSSAVAHIMPAGMNGGQITIWHAMAKIMYFKSKAAMYLMPLQG